MSGDTSRPKIVLACLPHVARPQLNSPMAAARLKAAAYQFGLLNEVDIEILSPDVSSNFGCRVLVERIVALRPAILGFTLYLWNVERSLYIAREVKKELPHVQIVVGGPEVSREAVHLLSDPCIDISVHGEGEITFVEILKRFLHASPELSQISGVSYCRDGEIVTTRPRPRISDMELIPSPYLLGYLDPRQCAQMAIFTMKGCVLGCSYCLWSGRGGLLPFGLDRIRQELILAKQSDIVTHVAIWDSAFNVSPVFAPVCKMIQEINSDRRLVFTCFMLAELVDEETARLLRQANITQVDVGLQSSNPTVLSHVGRRIDPVRFVAGVRMLEQEDIRVTVDVILGLPGDSLATFEDTTRFCAENRLNYRVFNLCLGYGTALRRQQEKFGLKILRDPPYAVWQTATFPRDDLNVARKRHINRCIDLDKMHELAYPVIMSSLPLSFPENARDSLSMLQNLAQPVRNIVLKMDSAPKDASQATAIAEAISKKIGSRLNLLYHGKFQTLVDSVWLIRELLARISSQNPYLICDVLLDTEGCKVPQALLDEILSFIQSRVQFLDRRDEIFPKLPFAITRRANVFVVMHGGADAEKEPRVDDSSRIRIATISAGRPLGPQIQEVMKARAGGLLIEFERESHIDLIRSAMELLVHSEKNIYFKDWALHRIWEQDYDNFPPEQQSHYEVAIDQDLNMIGKSFDEDELWLLTLMQRAGSDATPEAWQAYTESNGTGEV
jgi:hypothetical protein